MSNTKKRILHLTHDMEVGGAEQVIRQLILAMDSSMFEFSVVCLDGIVGSLGADLQSSGVHVESVCRRSGFDLRTVKNIRSLIKRDKFDVIHCHQYTPFCYGVVAAALLNTDVIFTEHGRFHPDRYTWKRRIANQFLYRQARHIVAISDATKRALQKYEWIPSKAVIVVYNGVDVTQTESSSNDVRKTLGIGSDVIVLGTIARLDSIKNQRMMILALAKLLPKYPKTVLILAGDGPELHKLKSLILQYDVEKNVIFTGFITDIAAYLQVIDIFLLTSFSEGTSMTLLEAMSFSKAIVATAVGGNIELLKNNSSGLLVDSDDVSGLCEALKLLFVDRATRERLGLQARYDYQKRFTRRTMVLAYEELYS